MASVSELADALRRAGVAEVDITTRRRAEYSSDASNYRVVPAAVAFPRHADEVAAALAVCRAQGVPVTARGAGTSIAGNAVGAGLVLDISRHLNRVLSVDPEGRTATVEPGTVLDTITAAAAAHGLRFGPDPSTHARATIGGSLGNNACGSRALAYGRTANNVVALDVLACDGTRVDGIPSTVDTLVHTRLALIRTEFGRFTRQVSGYSLENLLPENGADLAKFLVGTEGTLGVITGATVRLVTAPRFTALAVLGYADLAATAAEAAAAAHALIADAGCLDSVVVTGAAARAAWRMREDGAGLAGRTPAGRPAWPGWEDAAVPPEKLGAYLREFAALMGQHGVDGLAYGHFGDGCVHARIDFPLASRPHVLRDFVVDAARLVGGYGGSMSGEHGDGRARGELLPYMYTPAAIETFAAIKHAFDPDDVLNPGVIVRPAPLDTDLRVPAARPLTRLGFAYPDDGGDLSTAVHRCVGVGKCRADTGGVMCPSYLATRDEKDSTRGRARVLQEVANGSLVQGWRAAELTEALDLCLSCKGCSVDCPAGVDMATYKSEVLHQRYRGRPRPAAHYALG